MHPFIYETISKITSHKIPGRFDCRLPRLVTNPASFLHPLHVVLPFSRSFYSIVRVFQRYPILLGYIITSVCRDVGMLGLQINCYFWRKLYTLK